MKDIVQIFHVDGIVGLHTDAPVIGTQVRALVAVGKYDSGLAVFLQLGDAVTENYKGIHLIQALLDFVPGLLGHGQVLYVGYRNGFHHVHLRDYLLHLFLDILHIIGSPYLLRLGLQILELTRAAGSLPESGMLQKSHQGTDI